MEQIPDMGTLLRLAQKPAGQQLLALLQRSGGEELSQAIFKAASGDYQQAKQIQDGKNSRHCKDSKSFATKTVYCSSVPQWIGMDDGRRFHKIQPIAVGSKVAAVDKRTDFLCSENQVFMFLALLSRR